MKSLSVKPFGETKQGEPVQIFTLTNSNGRIAQILDFGGVLYSMEIPDRQVSLANVSARLSTVQEYQERRPYFGSLIGRYGNRIAQGEFSIDGKEYHLPKNNGPNALHGGLKGFDQKIWQTTPFEEDGIVGLEMSYHSPDGEEGYPGNLDVFVKYVLTDHDELIIDYTATTDQATPVNLTNHTFWNMRGALSGSILDQEIRIGASCYLPTDAGLIPTGKIEPVDGTPLDFRKGKTIGEDIAKTGPQFNGGFDHCLILDPPTGENGRFRFCAEVYDPQSGRGMEIKTTEPAVQFYSGNFLNGSLVYQGFHYNKQSAYCLETQHYPDSPNQPQFPNTILRPGETYRQTTSHRFFVR